MNWKEQLKLLEQNKQWDEAIGFMQEVIRNNPEDMNAYLNMNYLLMNLLVEENYDEKKHDYYVDLIEKYFNESYAKFSENAEYLFFIGIVGRISEWFFDLELEDVEAMLQKAINLDPDNVLYHCNLDKTDPKNKSKIIVCARLISSDDPSMKKILESKGSLGEYAWGFMKYWAERRLSENS